VPAAGATDHTVHVMWSSCVMPDVSGQKVWTPNHIVPLLCKSSYVQIGDDDNSSGDEIDEIEDDFRTVPMTSTPIKQYSVRRQSLHQMRSDQSGDDESSETLPAFFTDTGRQKHIANRKRHTSIVNTTITFMSDDSDSCSGNRTLQYDYDISACDVDDPVQLPKMPTLKRERNSAGRFDATYDVAFVEATDSTGEIDFVESAASNARSLETNDFLSVADTIQLMRTGVNAVAAVPTGVKNNVFFVLNDDHNSARRLKGVKGKYWDDCGSWKKGTCPTTHYRQRDDGSYQTLRLTKNGYAIRNKSTYTVLHPQPDPCEVITLHRYYTSLKADDKYKGVASRFQVIHCWIHRQDRLQSWNTSASLRVV